jgi:hypothetical protein
VHGNPLNLQRNPYSSFSLSCKGKDNFPKGPHYVRWESQEKCLLFIQETYPPVKTPNPLFLLSLVPYYHISSPLTQEYFHWLAWILTHVGRVQKLSPKIFGEPNSLVQGTYINPPPRRKKNALLKVHSLTLKAPFVGLKLAHVDHYVA